MCTSWGTPQHFPFNLCANRSFLFNKINSFKLSNFHPVQTMKLINQNLHLYYMITKFSNVYFICSADSSVYLS